MRVPLVEEHGHLAETIVDRFRSEGYAIDREADGARAAALLAHEEFDTNALHARVLAGRGRSRLHRGRRDRFGDGSPGRPREPRPRPCLRPRAATPTEWRRELFGFTEKPAVVVYDRAGDGDDALRPHPPRRRPPGSPRRSQDAHLLRALDSLQAPAGDDAVTRSRSGLLGHGRPSVPDAARRPTGGTGSGHSPRRPDDRASPAGPRSRSRGAGRWPSRIGRTSRAAPGSRRGRTRKRVRLARRVLAGTAPCPRQDG